MIVKTEAIVLNSFKYGESSKIVTLYSKEYGKIKVIAKGSRKAKNKFGSALDPLSYCQISFYHKPTTELFLLSYAEHIVPLRKIQDSYHHLSAGLIIVEAINITQDINEINIELFNLLAESMVTLNEMPNSPFSLSTCFLIQLSEIIGFAIDFHSYGINTQGNQSNKKILFSMERGTFVNSAIEKNTFSFDAKAAEALYEISSSSISSAGEINIEISTIKQLHDFFNLYFSYHLDRKNSFKTMNLFKTIIY